LSDFQTDSNVDPLYFPKSNTGNTGNTGSGGMVGVAVGVAVVVVPVAIASGVVVPNINPQAFDNM
jgi:hypothetical protein